MSDTLGAIFEQPNGRFGLQYADHLSFDDALKLLHLYVALFKAKREAMAATALAEDDRWEWG